MNTDEELMKSFTVRKKGFEAEFKRNQELLFQVTARRNRLFGLWAAVRLGLPGFVRLTGWLGSEVAGRLARWLKSHTAATAFRRLSSSMLCGSTCASR
jgi:ATPase inhibitor subunit zeta